MRAIVLAAGQGRRLRPHTDSVPKCLVPVRGRPMLHWQVDALVAAGVTELVIVRGYRGDALERAASALPVRPRFIDNPAFATTNILGSLLCAIDELDAAAFISYADIVYRPEVAVALTAANDPAPIALAVDRDYHAAYTGRTDHPIAEAELCRVDGDRRVVAIGKRSCDDTEAFGEYIGLARVSAEAAVALRAACDTVASQFRGRADAPFIRGRPYADAYFADLLQFMIDGGAAVTAVPIHGGWREIDTLQDLARAERDGW